MKSYRIKLNGKYISGISDECYDTPIGNNSWYSERNGMERFLFGDPIEIEGNWTLKSYLEKIMIAVKAEEIILKELIVEGV